MTLNAIVSCQLVGAFIIFVFLLLAFQLELFVCHPWLGISKTSQGDIINTIESRQVPLCLYLPLLFSV